MDKMVIKEKEKMLLNPFMIDLFEMIGDGEIGRINEKKLVYPYIDWTIEKEFKNKSFSVLCQNVSEKDFALSVESKRIEREIIRALEEVNEKEEFYENTEL